MSRLTRRRALFIAAAATAMPLFGRAGPAAEARWQGAALGAHAEMRIRDLDPAEAAPVFAAVEAELARLERIFSLYKSDSAISTLNATGRLQDPPPELLEVLGLAGAVHAETGGLFDPSVQPLFRLYAEAGAAGRPVMENDLQTIAGVVDFQSVTFDASAVEFTRAGMALTLNGVAQGYVTDRIAALLRREGLSNVLVDIGEIAAVGTAADGQGWPVRIANGGPRLRLSDRAVATSMPLGTRLYASENIGHIFHPSRGWIVPQQRQVSVVAETAALADAVSTAAVLMPDEALDVLRRRGFEIFSV
ncbi:FAD:protein FMN transferase [Rhodobacteraceae bacterium DSL-40]|uniref:FAD:protein FMN transferase n=1 Tax=Amaricoccus sp. B4 TaxID=3368557 RepID=UPI000DAC7CF2